MINWSEFAQFEDINRKYLPESGEGKTKATQIVTAVNKLIYKFYNDGDVFDNNYGLEGWANDLSTYANWLLNRAGVKELNKIYDIRTEDEYSELLLKVAVKCLNEDFLSSFNEEPASGSIYNEDGPFEFNEHFEDEDDYDEDY